MKILFHILFISLFLGIFNLCVKEGEASPTPEECFSRTVLMEEIDSGDVNDFTCCYMKEREYSNSRCFALEKSQFSTFKQEWKNNEGYEPYSLEFLLLY